MTDKSIYQSTFANAMKHGELDAFRESNQRNQDCAAAIDKAISDSRHDQHSYNLSSALDSVSKEFGLERVTWVVAATIRHYDYDGRFSRANKDWAQQFPVPWDRESGVFLNTHLTVLDGASRTKCAERGFTSWRRQWAHMKKATTWPNATA